MLLPSRMKHTPIRHCFSKCVTYSFKVNKDVLSSEHRTFYSTKVALVDLLPHPQFSILIWWTILHNNYMESSADAEYSILNVNNLEKIIMFYGLTLGLNTLVSIKLSTVCPWEILLGLRHWSTLQDCKTFLYVMLYFVICSVYQHCYSFMLMVEKNCKQNVYPQIYVRTLETHRCRNTQLYVTNRSIHKPQPEI